MNTQLSRKTWLVLTLVIALLLGAGAGAAYWYHEAYKPRITCLLVGTYPQEKYPGAATYYPRKPWELEPTPSR